MSEQNQNQNQSPTPEPTEQAVTLKIEEAKNVTWYAREMKARRRAAGTILPAQPSAIWEGEPQSIEAAWERITGKDLRSCLLGQEDVYPVEVYGPEAGDTINEDAKFPLKLRAQESWAVLMSNGLQIQILKEGLCSICTGSMNYIQAACLETDVFPAGTFEQGLSYLTLGLCGETGEYAEKVKKLLRGDQAQQTPEAEELRRKELGDILWYLFVAIRWEHATAADVAIQTLIKLADRANRGVLKGSGDKR